MMPRLARLVAPLALGWTTAIASMAGAQPAESAPSRALELHDEAKTLYAEGRYEAALDKLDEAVRLDPDAKLLHYNLGLIEEKLGNLDEAIGHYRRCLELERGERERAKLEGIISRLEGAREAGTFEQRSRAEPAPVETKPAPRPSRGAQVSPWVWVVGSASVASFASASLLAMRAAELHPGDEATTGQGVTLDRLESDANEAHALAIGADVMLGVGGAAAVATVVVAVVTIERDDPAESGWSLRVGPGRGTIAWRF